MTRSGVSWFASRFGAGAGVLMSARGERQRERLRALMAGSILQSSNSGSGAPPEPTCSYLFTKVVFLLEFFSTF
jgi:hypothetical protein